jgi:hypothetical protein
VGSDAGVDELVVEECVDGDPQTPHGAVDDRSSARRPVGVKPLVRRESSHRVAILSMVSSEASATATQPEEGIAAMPSVTVPRTTSS